MHNIIWTTTFRVRYKLHSYSSCWMFDTSPGINLSQKGF